MLLRLCLLLPVLAALLAGCGSRRTDWPTLAPRAGELTTMVPRNVAGGGRCATAADCAPPPAPIPAGVAVAMPPPETVPSRAAAQAELNAIAAIITAVQAAAGPAQTALFTARQSAAGSARDSAAASRAEAALSGLSAALTPLAGAAFRLQALDLATATARERATYADQFAALANRIAALQDQ